MGGLQPEDSAAVDHQIDIRPRHIAHVHEQFQNHVHLFSS